MNKDHFMSEVDQFLEDVRAEAERLLDSDVLSEHCLDIAIRIANSRAGKRAITHGQLLVDLAARNANRGMQ
ncbi:MAG TPA: hypothetical protein VGY48_12570 [Vicinamibacterales bacterium]|jgi:hypothetical protein|nr:hypothetical protein [Vicinamibacterales bacterium]